MAISPSQYEDVLSRYSDSAQATHLLRQYRPYLEMIPSMRRPQESLISIPLPIAEIQIPAASSDQRSQIKSLILPCDLVFLMCDPEWKVKTDVEILILIHRPGESFSALLTRWRQTQVILSRAYSWDMPLQHRDVFSEGASRRLPLFVLFKETSTLIKRGMKAARLPHVIQPSPPEPQTVTAEKLVTDK